MSMRLGRSIEQSVDRLTTPAAGALVVLFAVVNVVTNVAVESAGFTDQGAAGQPAWLQPPAAHLSVELGVGPAIALALVGYFATLAVYAVAVDAFVRGVDQPGDLRLPRPGWTLGNLFAGWIAYGVVVAIGLILLVLPGIVAAIVLLFFPVAVVVDGEWFGAAFASSVGVVRDNVLATLGIVAVLLAVGVFQLIAQTVLTVIATDAVTGAVATLLLGVVGGVVGLFTAGLLTFGYVGATEDGDAGGASGDAVGAPGQTV